MSNAPTAYFIFFCPKGVSAHPIAVYFDKKKAIKHIHAHGNEYTELRQCAWGEGVLPRWVDSTLVKVPEKKAKKKKEDKARNMTSEEKKLTHEFVLSKFENKDNNESNNRIPIT